MRHRNRRLATIAVAGAVLVGAIALAMFAMKDALIYFYSPTEIAEEGVDIGERIRVGGLVVEGSIQPGEGQYVAFRVTDTAHDILIEYDGILPDLFREGQGVVVEGAFQTADVFSAETVLAKHDETYMPPEVAEALQESGVWQGEGDNGESEY
ncbi:MAG: cytochrome c maturation protein CcmE [Maricaulis sp.]|jgi:cytochrome c-type biogenesis protein CcmE|uniref:cytochrome c maturation protein CcmE n=1 Tax=Maricaulis sp. TaxID=1486257 RepID=UPI001B0F060C|nr:cytochrome c maturation protein CcmE [Maricaulis sp.]MBO6730833.1 cytochrome c maturation protein CcmE [Maricaulis sp.]MBO6848298.1 cytochrome c maturation protein CcmE [Maricaulis sp.]MBO6878177.1 cytochrome c maturation protein CcmE [Maricaulis sp.]MDM7983420.1 cytochrome c maturation protein CcmE [Maricaulis sp.]